MGNICASNKSQHSIRHSSTQLTRSTASPTASIPSLTAVPTLFDLCLEHLCQRLIDDANALSHSNFHGRRRASTPHSGRSGMTFSGGADDWQVNVGAANSVPMRARSMSLSSHASPELAPLNMAPIAVGSPHSNREPPWQTLTPTSGSTTPTRNLSAMQMMTARRLSLPFSQRQTANAQEITANAPSPRRPHLHAAPQSMPPVPALARPSHLLQHSQSASLPATPRPSNETPMNLHLPDSIIQIIFDRLVQHKLLTLNHCRLFAHANLTRLVIPSYPNITDEWIDLLLTSVRMEAPLDDKFDLAALEKKTSELVLDLNDEDDEDDDTSVSVTDMLRRQISQDIQAGTDSNQPTPFIAEPTKPLSPTTVHHSPPHQPSLTVQTSSSLSAKSIITDASSSTTSSSIPPLNLSPVLKPVRTMSSLLNFAPSLSHVDLRECDTLTDSVLLPLIHCHRLSYINFDKLSQITDRLICQIVQRKPLLTFLDVSSCRGITNQSLLAISQAVPPLKSLLLDRTSISNTGLCYLHVLHTLEHLSVGWNGQRVTSDGLTWLHQSTPKLRNLCISYTGVTDSSIYRHCLQLRILNIAGTRFNDSNTNTTRNSTTIDTMSNPNYTTNNIPFPRLEQLIMSKCKIKDIPATFCTNSLRVLDLSFTSINGTKLLQTLNQLAKIPTNRQHNHQRLSDEIDFEHSDDEEEHDGWRSIDPHTNHSIDMTDSSLSQSVTPQSSVPSSPLVTSLSSTHNRQFAFSPAASHSMPLLPIRAPALPHIPLLDATSLSSATSPALRVLRLENCSLDNNVMTAIGGFTGLTELNMVDTDVSSDAFANVSRLHNLTSLNVNGCKLTNTSLSAVAGLKSLRILHIDCATITDGGMIHISGLTQLEKLDMFETSVTDAGIEHLTHLSKLRSFECCCGKLTNASLAIIGSEMVSLTSLNVGQNSQINDGGLHHLSKLTHLTHVNLSCTGTTDKGLAFIKDLCNVRTVSLFGCKDFPWHKCMDLPVGIQLAVDQGIVGVD